MSYEEWVKTLPESCQPEHLTHDEYAAWARDFAQRHDLPFEGLMLLAGYRK